MKRLTGVVETAEIPLSLSPGVPLVPEVESPSLIKLLRSLLKEDGTDLLNEDEAITLTQLVFRRSKKPILDLKHRYFIYEIVWLVNQIGYDNTLSFLSADWEKILGNTDIRSKILRQSPLLRFAKDKMELDMEIYRSRVDISTGAVDCKKCRSDRTISVERQLRSADEPMTIKVTCIECGYKWTAQ